MTDTETVLRDVAAAIAGLRSDVSSLLELQKQSAADRLVVNQELHKIDLRLTIVERDVTLILRNREEEAPMRKKVAAWLAVGGAALVVLGGVMTGMIPQWLRDLSK